ncbi:hypothetical protein V2O64_03305 [Verrucomicrobiaceae bacterium 227]
MALPRKGAKVRSLFLLLMALFLAGCNPEQGEVEEIPTGYRGKARVNPYLAAERYLNESGWDARSSRVWDDFNYQTGVVFMSGSFLASKVEGMRALEWVAQGGLLVLTIEGGEPERNDFTSNDSGLGMPAEGDYPGLDHVLAESGVGMVYEDWEGVQTTADPIAAGHTRRSWHIASVENEDGEAFDLEFEGNVGLVVEKGRDWEGNHSLSSRVVSTEHQLGRIVVMAHARPLRSPYLDRADHALFLESVAEESSGGEIVFLYGSSLSFSGLIWQRAWMVVIAGLILLFFWLWMRIPRLGPVLEDSFQTKRPYGEALTASARFLWRSGHVEHMIRPLRAKLESEHQGDPANLYRRLADQTGLTRDEVAEALTLPPPKDSGTLIQLVQKLQTLLKR